MGKMIVVYCLDYNYIDITEISMRSVKKYNPQAHIVAVSEDGISVNGLEDEIVTIKLPKMFRNRGWGDRITNTAYLKLFLTKLGYDKIVYVDGDTICQEPLNELWSKKCDYINLCESHTRGIEQAQDLGLDKYGITGMMVMNLKNLRKIGFTELCLNVEKNPPKMKCEWQHDETCINVAMNGRLNFIDKKYNYCINRNYNDPIREEDAVILHYVGNQKDLMTRQYIGVDAILNNIKGKDVAIVGNAKSIFDKKYGEEIDKHNFVIRFNNGFPEKKECQGAKTSMVVLALNMEKEKADIYNARWIVNRSRSYDNQYANLTIPNSDRRKLKDKLLSQPSSGFMAIDLCLYANAKSITLYGFAGNSQPTYYNPKNYVTQHNYDKEQETIHLYEKCGLLTIRG